jgi:2-polyprenyl-3-methyl-5-hydroxy-6-metoxy-1,4-benzoquinol methylase
MIKLDGWGRYNIWDHSPAVLDLYTRRARREAEEMTCAAQAAELLRDIASPGDTLLDVGCGTGYFFHSLRDRGVAVEYTGVDATARFIEIGRATLPSFGLGRERLVAGRIEDLDGEVDHVVCMNVLSNLDNYHRPLERMLVMARRSVILRESIKDGAEYRYVLDKYLETDRPLRVHVNAYDRREIASFIGSYGFAVREVVDARAGGAPELVIDYPHYWTFLVATRR